MPFLISAANEADIASIVRVHFSAFDREPYHEALYPGGNCPSVRDVAAARVLEEWQSTPQQRIIKCTDTDNDQIIGFATWNLYDQERPASEWQKVHPVDWCEGRDKELAELFLHSTMDRRQRIWEGQKHYLCALLCVHPQYQRRGAGTALMQWGLLAAEKAGLPAYLEASIHGRPLYHRLGFQDIESEEIIIPAESWGGDRTARYMPMVRYPSQIKS